MRPRLSVVIPTYNRRATLERCLAALRRQTLDRPLFEIIVVDDGSTDQTSDFLRQQPDIRAWCQPKNAGPAAARNVGVRLANGEIVLFIGDDIYLKHDALERHLAIHDAANGDGTLAVLGYCPWATDAAITPLMKSLMDGRVLPQFHYYAIKDPSDLDASFFYTSNISVAKAMLDEHGVFDENFRYAMGEDGELGLRLKRAGLRIVFRPEIVGEHDHPTSYRSVRRRARISGQVSYMIYQKHPSVVSTLFTDTWTRRQWITMWMKRQFVTGMLDPLLTLADRMRLDSEPVWRAWAWALDIHKVGGLLDAARRA